jgi:DNA-directed RNA polymerase
VPKRPPDAEFKAKSVEERKLLAKTIKGLKKANRPTWSTPCVRAGHEGRRTAGVVERFYCPMNMDWRTRVYALTHFNFQREDRVRAMFLFANGEAHR